MHQAEKKVLKKLIPKRKKTDNKSAGGRCLIIGGSESMPGAGLLAAKAAARVGAGYVFLGGLDNYSSLSKKKSVLPVLPDFIPLNIKTKIDFRKYQAIAIGPGLGLTPLSKNQMKRWFRTLISSGAKNVVVDADAINFLAQNQHFLPLPPDWVITPHAGELARILKLKKPIQPQDRKKLLLHAQKQIGCNLLLKGNPTYLIDRKKIKTISSGNKSLAKAGTGDVLTGMTAGFMAQGLKAFDAAFLAASIHGLMATEWIKSKDYLSLMASDLIEMIPATLFKLRK